MINLSPNLMLNLFYIFHLYLVNYVDILVVNFCVISAYDIPLPYNFTEILLFTESLIIN